jgi:hypothetical protein
MDLLYHKKTKLTIQNWVFSILSSMLRTMCFMAPLLSNRHYYHQSKLEYYKTGKKHCSQLPYKFVFLHRKGLSKECNSRCKGKLEYYKTGKKHCSQLPYKFVFLHRKGLSKECNSRCMRGYKFFGQYKNFLRSYQHKEILCKYQHSFGYCSH